MHVRCDVCVLGRLREPKYPSRAPSCHAQPVVLMGPHGLDALNAATSCRYTIATPRLALRRRGRDAANRTNQAVDVKPAVVC